MGELMKKHSIVLGLVILMSVPLPALASDHSAEFKEICGTLLQSNNSSNLPEARRPYCEAAQQSMTAEASFNTLTGIWEAVSAVCATECALSWTSGGKGYVCDGAAGSAILWEVFAGHELSSLLSSSAAVAGSAITAKQLGVKFDKAEDWVKTQWKKRPACVGTAVAAMFAIQRGMSGKNADRSVQDSLSQAKAVIAGNGSQYSGGIGAEMASGSASAPSLSFSGTSATSTEQNNSRVLQNCGGSGTSAADGAIACATASDKQLPSFVSSPTFSQKFEKVSGTKLENFLKKDFNSAPSDINQIMQGAFGSAEGLKMGNLLAEGSKRLPNQQLSTDTAEASYTQAGGRSPANNSNASDPGIDKMFANIMGQMLQKDENQTRKSGIDLVEFLNQTRSPAAITEDSSLSLFDRVSYRYRKVVPQMQ